jgi:crotonobetainyl-CoA:carnitine CoA-transferase CaiB-like acyl-CoA transferase
MGLSVAPVNSIREVAGLEFVKNQMVRTVMPDGRELELSPPSSATDFLEQNNFTLKFAPALGEHNSKILQEAGYNTTQIIQLEKEKII